MMKFIFPGLLLVPSVIGTSSIDQDDAMGGRLRALAVDEGSYYLPIDGTSLSFAGLERDPLATPSAKSDKTGTTTPSAKSSKSGSKKQCEKFYYNTPDVTDELKIKLCETKSEVFGRLECTSLYEEAIAWGDGVNCEGLLKCQALLFGDPCDPHPTDCEFATEFICSAGAENMLLAGKICTDILLLPPP